MEVASLNEGEWLCYRGSLFILGGMVVTEVASLKEGEWSSYRSGQFKRGKMVMLQRWPVFCRENGHVTKVVTLMGGRMVMLQRWPV